MLQCRCIQSICLFVNTNNNKLYKNKDQFLNPQINFMEEFELYYNNPNMSESLVHTSLDGEEVKELKQNLENHFKN